MIRPRLERLVEQVLNEHSSKTSTELKFSASCHGWASQAYADMDSSLAGIFDTSNANLACDQTVQDNAVLSMQEDSAS